MLLAKKEIRTEGVLEPKALDTVRLNRKPRVARTPMGHRSMLESRGIQQLNEAGLPNHYEAVKISYIKPASRHFYLTDSAVGHLNIPPAGKKPIHFCEVFIGSILFFIEYKGYPFTAQDRKKYLLVRAQNPGIDLRFVFANAHKKIRNNSKTSYGMWARKHHFKYAHGCIPDEWLEEAKLGLKAQSKKDSLKV